MRTRVLINKKPRSKGLKVKDGFKIIHGPCMDTIMYDRRKYSPDEKKVRTIIDQLSFGHKIASCDMNLFLAGRVSIYYDCFASNKYARRRAVMEICDALATKQTI